jgi:hypothetical protein
MRLAFACLLFATAAAAQPLVLEGELPTEGPSFVLIPFDVPAGTVELEVRHPVQQPENILDYGVRDPAGFRGWGGGNKEPIVLAADRTSRSYLTGPITAGTWKVIIGKAKVVTSPAKYRLEIDFRTTVTLPAQPERKPYVAAAALETAARWYAGDFHAHSKESGDAQPTLDAMATYAQGRGLDFLELSDHNTVSQLDFMLDAQARFPKLLFVPGVEFTTYDGHANGIGATAYVDHLLGIDGNTFEGATAGFAAQDAVLSINHPALDLGTTCIGCAWKQKIPKGTLGAVEIGTGGWDVTGLLFTRQAITFWDGLVRAGLHVAPVGGSDDHSGGVITDSFSSPIGNPTTMVFASGLSAKAIVDGVRHGRTVVKLQGPGDPMIELEKIGETVRAETLTLSAKVTGGVGHQLKWIHAGEVAATVDLTSDPQTVTQSATAPTDGSEDRWRAEVWVDGNVRTVTGHVWLSKPEPMPAPMKNGCDATLAWPALGALVLLLKAIRGTRSAR